MKPTKITAEWLQSQLQNVNQGIRQHARAGGDTAVYRALLARREQLEAELKLIERGELAA